MEQLLAEAAAEAEAQPQIPPLLCRWAAVDCRQTHRWARNQVFRCMEPERAWARECRPPRIPLLSRGQSQQISYRVARVRLVAAVAPPLLAMDVDIVAAEEEHGIEQAESTLGTGGRTRMVHPHSVDWVELEAEQKPARAPTAFQVISASMIPPEQK